MIKHEGTSHLATIYDEARHPFGLPDILGFIRQGDLVMDGGCGTGHHAQQLAAVAGQVVGIDVDAHRIALARARCRDLDNVSFEVGSVTKLPYQDGSFDVVLLAQVLHHLIAASLHSSKSRRQQCELALVEGRRVLRAGGLLVLVTTSRVQRRAAYWHFNLFPQSAWQRLDSIWSLTDDTWFTSTMERLGFVAAGSATPSESHWVDAPGEELIRRGLDEGWRSTDAAFELLTPTEMEEFVTLVSTALADGTASAMANVAREGRLFYGEATVHAYRKLGAF